MDGLLAKLNEIYAELPPVPCKACGHCCVSPTCTIIEFVGAVRYALANFEKEKLSAILIQPAVIHPDYEGNLYCCFQSKETKNCMIHPSRTMACRLFGLPVLSELSINNMENCSKLDVSKIQNPSKEKLNVWLRSLTDLNREAASFYSEPYWVSGFNIECWLAVYFDPLLTDGVFGELKSLLRNTLDLSFLEDRFVDKTNLKDKIDRIALLYMLIDTGSLSEAKELIARIRNDYPLTGTYYLEELDKLESIIVSQASV
jgi:Fe-S-cluster containining protein